MIERKVVVKEIALLNIRRLELFLKKSLDGEDLERRLRYLQEIEEYIEQTTTQYHDEEHAWATFEYEGVKFFVHNKCKVNPRWLFYEPTEFCPRCSMKMFLSEEEPIFKKYEGGKKYEEKRGRKIVWVNDIDDIIKEE